MKITDRIHLVGSGRMGFDLTDAFDCHVYLLDGGEEYALIDTGAGRDVDQILDRVREDGLDPTRIRHILLTHAHADHSGGAAGLRERLDVSIAASAEAAGMVRSGEERPLSLDVARKAGAYPDDYRFRACEIDLEVADGDRYSVGDLELQVIATPGHSSDQIAFVLRRDRRVDVFCGDALFEGGRILLQDIWNCSAQDSCRSVEKLHALKMDGFFPGHRGFSVHRGLKHAEAAMEKIRQLLPPDQLA
jgi:glyoxylase-like metal-dependent hydrolase (beta-lactamase superfamily II)